MSRWLFPWSGSIKKRACRYLLQHYLGHFLQERLTLDQLSLDLYNGSGIIRDIHLDIWSVNELLGSLGAPLELVDGFVSSISVTIPWAALVTDHCTVEVSGLQLTCRPKYRSSGGWDSQGWSSCMTSSMQLAQECLKDPPEASEEPPAPLEGLEMFAQTIETVLRRIRVTFLDTIVRVEHQPLTSDPIALEMHIKRLDYCDEAVRDSSQAPPVDIHQPPAVLHKILQLSAVQLLYEASGAAQVPHSPAPGNTGIQITHRLTHRLSDSEGDPVGDPITPGDGAPTHCPLLIGSCSGFIEMSLKIKQNDALPGPKVELDGKLGCLHLLLSPGQIAHLSDLLTALCIHTEPAGGAEAGHSRPLGSDDLRLIEEDLSKQLSGDSGGERERGSDGEGDYFLSSLENGGVECCVAEMFYSMGAGMSSSVTSVLSDCSLTSSCSTLSPGVPPQAHTHTDRDKYNNTHKNTEKHILTQTLTTFLLSISVCLCASVSGRSSQRRPVEPLKTDALLRLSLGGVTLTLLEEEPPADLAGSHGPQGAVPLAKVSRLFFQELGYFKDTMFSGRDFAPLRESFARACPHSHLRLTGSAVQLTCEMRSAGHHSSEVTSDLSFSCLELLECLFDPTTPGAPQYTEVLLFPGRGAAQFSQSMKPCAVLQHRLTERATHRVQREAGVKQRIVCRNSAMRVELTQFCSELDLDLLTRLDTLTSALTPPDTHSPPNMQVEQVSLPLFLSLCLCVSVFVSLHASPLSLQAAVCFRNVLINLLTSLSLSLCQEYMMMGRGGRSPVSEYRNAKTSHRVTRTAPPGQPTPSPSLRFIFRMSFIGMTSLFGIAVAYAVVSIYLLSLSLPLPQSKYNNYISHSFYLSLRLYASCTKVVVRCSTGPSSVGGPGWAGGVLGGVDVGLDSMDSVESPCDLRQTESSPFASSRTMFETEEMVLPAAPGEMGQFQKLCVSESQWAVELSLPQAALLLPSKQAYQSLYNRINNDLLMWEPPPSPPSPGPPHRPQGTQEQFRMCKSAFRLDSDSEEEEPQFFSANESQKHKGEVPRTDSAHNFLSLTIHIGKGRICAMTDKLAEGGHGELVLDVEGGKIFSVTQHHGDPNLSFLCLEGEKVELHHRAVLPDAPLPERLEVPSFSPPPHLDCIIYPSEVGVSSVGSGDVGGQMLSTAIKITIDPKRNVKEFLVALRLHGATLRHRMALANQSWHEQLIDFLDVIDEPILGYTPPAVITVLHTHLLSCAVDYRPLYLPVRVLFTAESFSLSSNIIVDTATFHLRFILDDSALYLSDRCDTDTVDLRRDYVCVLDIDLLELAITTWRGSEGERLPQPLFELRCSNNVVHLHTCADSCATLVNLLQYLVSHGDQHPPPRHHSPTEIAGQKLPDTLTDSQLIDSLWCVSQLSESPASLPPCLPAETAEINQCDLTDALIDTEKSQQDEEAGAGSPVSVPRGSPVSVYLFPGETPKPRPPDSLEVEDGEEPKLDGLLSASRDGEPVVRVLAPGQVRVRDGYFSRPWGSCDVLRAPGQFPVPHTRVALRDVSLVWHLYGGSDLGARGHPPHSHRGRSAPPSARASPSRSAPPRPQNSWRWQGGSAREHGLLMEIQLTKMSFQHESYPSAGGAVADGVGGVPGAERPLSRQVFVVQELEVRDRLASSQINKFLYLYTSESMPRRAHSNMLTVKAVQLCSESGVGGPECCLRISLMPLRLNIDQDALFFLKDFFSSVAAGINPYLPVDMATEDRQTKNCQIHNNHLNTNVNIKMSESCVSLSVNADSAEEAEPGQGVWPNPDITASMETTLSDQSSSSSAGSSSSDQPIYFREFRFTSEVPIWLDYQGKHVNIEQGTLSGILIGLAQLNCSELKLKRLCCRHGLLGVEKVINYAVNEWLSDIRKNQLPGILGGVGPMHSVVQLLYGRLMLSPSPSPSLFPSLSVHGVRDLFWLPIEQYRRDGRLIRGLQRGAASFGTSTASAALELSNRLVQAIQATAETVYDILSPTPPLSRALPERRPTHRRPPQPADLREGVAKAYDTVREGVIDTAQTICDVASRGHEQKGLPGAVGGVLRQIPPTVVRPLIVATEATSNLLGGMRNQIKPDARKEDFLKWRTDDNQD
ncbi:ATG2A protein, partial [Amia calva]|nr:ATG2A protein [Amia calva]